MRTRPESLKKRTSPEAFKALRSLPPDSPEWKELRDRIFEENRGLAHYAVDRAGWWFLNTFSKELRSQTGEELLQLAFIELSRVISVYDPDWPNPRDESKTVEFATFALKNLLLKVRAQCRKENEHLQKFALPPADDEEEDSEFSLDDFPAEPSHEVVEIERRERIENRFRGSDPALAARLVDILDKLRGGDDVTIFERRLLFKLIADPAVMLTPAARGGAAHRAASEGYEPFPLRRRRWWRQVLK